jgi:uncharacterized protein
MPRKINRRLRDFHVFSVNGKNLGYDGATGSLYLLDDTGKAFFESYKDNQEPEKAARCLAGKFSPEEIRETLDEFYELNEQTLLGDNVILQDTIQPDLQSQPPKAICLNVAHACNLGCKYCFASCGYFGGKAAQFMKKEVAFAAIDFLLRESRFRKHLDVDFFGGEPLLAFDVVRETLLYAEKKGKQAGKIFRFTITTNCTLLTPDIISFLNDHNVSVILSIDGRREIHDRMRPYQDGSPSYDIVLDAAKQMVESRRGKNYVIRGTYTRYNLDFDMDVRSLYHAGFKELSLEPAIGEPGLSWAIKDEDLPVISQSYSRLVSFWESTFKTGEPFNFFHFNLDLDKGVCIERRLTGCGAGYEYLAVTPEGTIYPCHQMVGQDDYILGNVFTGIDRPESSRQFHAARVSNKEKCIHCWARYLCGGGCHAAALASTGDIREPDGLTCRIMKTRLEYALLVQYISSI